MVSGPTAWGDFDGCSRVIGCHYRPLLTADVKMTAVFADETDREHTMQEGGLAWLWHPLKEIFLLPVFNLLMGRGSTSLGRSRVIGKDVYSSDVSIARMWRGLGRRELFSILPRNRLFDKVKPTLGSTAGIPST